MDEPANNSLTGTACLVFALAVLAGAALAWAVSPTLFRALPTDTSRIAVLLDTLNDEAQAPEILLFGTSVGMAGVDTAQITERLPEQPLAYNMSATGQAFMESYLYYQELPDSVDIVIQLISPNSFIRESVVDPQKYNAFYMYGYRPDERTRDVMGGIFPVEMGEQFAKSDLQQRFDSRWAARQMADRFARSLFRSDLTLDRGTYDLFYPSSYTRRLPEKQYRIALRNEFGHLQRSNFWPQENKFELLTDLVDRAADAGKQLVLVVEPIHPQLIATRSEAFYQGFDTAISEFGAANGVIVLNGRNKVAESDFVDAVHPTPGGAAIFTDWLAGELVRLRENGELSY